MPIFIIILVLVAIFIIPCIKIVPQAKSYVVERIGSDFYVLPSSVHELLLVRNDAGVDPAYLRQMVREVNAAEVQESEQLSDNIYTWSADAGLQIYE